jgi:phenylacetate-CoA ligase
LFNNNTLFSSYHLSEANIPAYIKKLHELNPIFIDSYPSAIYTIAQYIINRRIPNQIRPLAIITSSETLLEHQREAISRAFGCKIFDQYGNAEMAAFVCQCELGSYHVNMEYGIIELLEDGKPVPPGVRGELVCTGFLNKTMPLIRYKIGDSAVFSSHACECGRQTPCLESVEGRVDDIIMTTDGRMIGRLDPIFKGTSGIKETQIVQESPNYIAVKLVKGEAYKPGMGQDVIDELKKRVGDSMKIELVYVDQMERSSTG